MVCGIGDGMAASLSSPLPVALGPQGSQSEGASLNAPQRLWAEYWAHTLRPRWADPTRAHRLAGIGPSEGTGRSQGCWIPAPSRAGGWEFWPSSFDQHDAGLSLFLH